MTTSPTTARNRWFTGPPSPHGIAVNYNWDPNAVTGGANSVTGNYVPLEVPTYSTVSNTLPTGSMTAISAGLAFAANPGRKEVYAQVIGSGGPLYIAFSSAAASQTNVNVLLKPASSDFGQDGGIWDSTTYTGPVSISGAVGCRFILWQNTN